MWLESRVNIVLALLLAASVLFNVQVYFLHADPPPPPTTAAPATTIAAPVTPAPPVRYLSLPSFFSFNQLSVSDVRFSLEVGAALAHVMGRKLMLPRYVYMAKCLDEQLCSKSACETRRDILWCPIELLFDAAHLEAMGGVFDGYRPSLTRRVVRSAMDDIYDTGSMWFDRLPREIAGPSALTDHVFAKTTKPVLFHFYRYQMVCDYTFSNMIEKRWNSKQDSDASKRIYSMEQEYGADTAEVLVLEGRVGVVASMPLSWSTSRAQFEFDRLWRNGSSVYHHEITAFAAEVAAILSRGASYLAAHIDIDDIGSLTPERVSALVAYLQRQKATADEPIYLSTREHASGVLDAFREAGAVQWRDVTKLPQVVALLPKYPTLQVMVGFEEYVGLVEQMLCTHARAFVGTSCSSFTGQILNLRLKAHDEDVLNAFPGELAA